MTKNAKRAVPTFEFDGLEGDKLFLSRVDKQRGATLKSHASGTVNLVKYALIGDSYTMDIVSGAFSGAVPEAVRIPYAFLERILGNAVSLTIVETPGGILSTEFTVVQ